MLYYAAHYIEDAVAAQTVQDGTGLLDAAERTSQASRSVQTVKSTHTG